ncbi:hypothetical protein CHUAL_000944 [Chamberlinius hualienensis]
MSWAEIRQSAREMRNRFSNICKKVPSNFTFRTIHTETGLKIRLYFLSMPQNSRETTLMFADIPLDVSELPPNGLITSYSLLESTFQVFSYMGSASKEEQLQWERKRLMSWGITSYEVCVDTGKFVFPACGSLFTCVDSGLMTTPHFPLELKTSCQGARLNPQICPSNPDLVTYFCNGDIWIQHTNFGWDKRLTYSHKGGKSLSEDPVISGMPAYVTQEEFHRYIGAWWSPKLGADQTYRLLYEEVDESDVEILYFVSQTDQSVDEFRFPRAGTPNAKSTLKLIQFQLNELGQMVNVIHLHLHDRLELHFPWLEYLVRIGWTADGNFIWAQCLDRRQVHMEVILIPITEFVCGNDTRPSSSIPIMVLAQEVNEENWINVHGILYFLSSSKPNTLSFIWANEETGFRHLHLITVELNLNPKANHLMDIYERVCVLNVINKVALTSGDWEVSEKQIWVDEKHNVVYFTGLRSNPLEKHLYVVSLNAPGDVRQLTLSNYSHSIEMDKDCTKFVTVYSNISRLSVCEVFGLQWIEGKTSVYDVYVVSQGYLLEPSEPDENYRQPELFVHQLATKENLYCMIFTPANMQPNVKYPTILSVYGGPEVQLVNNSFKGMRFLRMHMLASHGYVVVVVDSRGSRNRGIKFESYIKKRMGTVEIADQVEALQVLAERTGYIDMDRVAIHGWSYGGYLSLMGLVQRPDVFKLAIAGAPVTTWKLYDTAYTERYMDLPSRNTTGYTNSSVLAHINNFPNEENRLLIIHGLSDENVHFSHTSQLINALVRAGKPYQLQVYPNERHSLCHIDASEHYESSLLSFLKQHL